MVKSTFKVIFVIFPYIYQQSMSLKLQSNLNLYPSLSYFVCQLVAWAILFTDFSDNNSKFIIISEYGVQMSCFTGCFRQNMSQGDIYNRTTNAPIRFNQNQLEQLRKKFLKVSVGSRVITRESFKKNMGILGLHCAQQFSQRMFNAFDLDNDEQINFQDFIEYMEILKCGSDANKARISFKMIAKKDEGSRGQRNRISQADFMEFLNDFFNSWSSITNISITHQIRQRTNQYVSFLFNKVKKETGKEQINIKYYIQKLYKDKDYMESFEFITQGMADIFISDREINDTNPETVLYKILKEVRDIKDTIFDFKTEESYQYEPVRMEETPRELPNFKTFFKPNLARRGSEDKQKTPQSTIGHRNSEQFQKTRRNHHVQHSETHDHTKTHNFLYESRKLQLKEAYQNNVIASLEKKLKFIQEKINHIVDSTKAIFTSLGQKFENRREQLRKGKNQTAKNVHKRANTKNRQGNMIFLGDDNWNLVLNMMIGIQMAVRSVRGFQEMIYEEPKDFGLKYYFELVPRRFGDEEYTSTIYSFTDYAPNTFNHIRKIFKIDNEDYIGSIGPNRLMASLMMGEVNSMTSLTSQGKSGSFFYYTADSKYMLKTISYRQYKFLRNILQDYYYYIKGNPQTLITKFFGLHKLIQKNQSGSQICRSYFVIMANVFNTREKIVQRYDIKGSWFGRETVDKDPTSTKKDNDFKKRAPIYLQDREREHILSIIAKDAKFFEEHDIIDYSLLIGVIKKSDRSSDTSEVRMDSRIMKDEQLQNLQSRIMVSQQENAESYIFGIIDILTPYDSKKVFEYYFKRLVYGDGISAVPPSDYAKRFVNFIENTVFPKA